MKTLAELCAELYDAKRIEDDACAKRVAIEEQIAAQVECGDNESKTVDGGGGLKVTIKRGIIYKANVDAIRDIGDMNLPGGVALPLKFIAPKPASYELDDRAYEALRTTCPTAFNMIAKYVDAKPRKVSVALKLA
jgi:hypothetical protein